jgi:hypothetical protein
MAAERLLMWPSILPQRTRADILRTYKMFFLILKITDSLYEIKSRVDEDI